MTELEKNLDILKESDGSLQLTEAQMQAVTAHGKILVSAAAGSGKTSTLVKRILFALACGQSLKSMLVLVYNNAAADDLKKRLRQKLFECACSSDGETGARFAKELDELGFCHISTIHAFCQSLIRENFDKLGISPTFEVVDEQTHKAYMSRAIDAVLNEYAAADDKIFLDICEIFAQARKEDNLKSNIYKLFRLMDIQPDRDAFLDKIKRCFGDFEGSEFQTELMSYYKTYFAEAKKLLEQCVVPLSETNMEKYKIALAEYIMICDKEFSANSFEDMLRYANGFEKPTLWRSKKNSTYEELLISDTVKTYIDDITKTFKDMSAIYEKFSYFRSAHTQNGVYIDKLLQLTVSFDEELKKIKAEKNVMSFEDLQHYTVRLLELAPELNNMFDSVFVDEYQDVDPTQEYIISRLVREECFMVGDIKQSIYGFRLADPTIFLHRQERYKNLGEGYAIDLNRNFRSKRNILKFVNDVFGAVMTKQVYDIDYKNEAAFDLTDMPEDDGNLVQLHLFVKPASSAEEVGGLYDITAHRTEKAEQSAATNEGIFIANEIRSLVGRAKVGDRVMRYDDIAILFRSRNGAQPILDALAAEGIPLATSAFSNADTGVERELINFLKVIDNPMQDIPLAGYLLSYFGGYDEDDLVKISSFDGGCLYEKLLAAAKAKDELAERLAHTLSELDKYRVKASFKSVAELMSGIISDYMYDAYIMRSGEGNVYALRSLCASSAACEFSLGRYLEEFEAPDDASGTRSGGDRVQVSTFHAFKGLEIPVVFIADMAHAFNVEAQRNDLLTVNSGYVGLKYFDLQNKYRYTTLSTLAASKMIRKNQMKDEMRLLYVALTRAKQLMYLTASLSEKKAAEFGSASKILDASSDLDIISKAAFLSDMSLPRFIHSESLSGHAATAAMPTVDKSVVEAVNRARKFEYKYEASTKLAMKFSVSALDVPDEQTIRVFDDRANVGTVYHKVMQLIDIFATDMSRVNEELNRMSEEKLLSDDERKVVDPGVVLDCLRSDVMQKARMASLDNKCFREYPFMMYKKAREISDEEKFMSDDKVLVQGIIDMFVDGEEKIIVDFKYSSLPDDKLVERYKKQLNLYKMAVESAFKCKVDKTLLYSFKTGRTIEC